MILTILIAAFIVVPVLELAVLFRVHDAVGTLNTLAIIVGTGVIGAILARLQGLMVVMAIQRDLAEGRMPAPRLIDGMMILVAGVLLVTPGLITDTAGFLLLVPAVRKGLRFWMRSKLERKLREGNTVVWRW